MMENPPPAPRLDSAQRETLSKATGNLLILGPAGTGKTRVLLEACAEGGRGWVDMVTFSRTLVKYDGFRAAEIAPDRPMTLNTSETLFWTLLRRAEPRHKVDYGLLQRVMPKINSTGFLSDKGLWMEIEEFLFGLNISRDEYLDSAVPRQGLRTPLNRSQREAVWTLRDGLVEKMMKWGVYSKHFARLRLLHWLRQDGAGLTVPGPLFVDESQDMAAVELVCLQEITESFVIMAGDTGQSIYGFINPYRRALVNLSSEGMSLLITNHRNSRPIHHCAEKYHQDSLLPGEKPGPQSRPYHEGPEPVFYCGENMEAMTELLIAHVRYQVSGEKRRLEGMGILCSRNAHLVSLKARFAEMGLEAVIVRDDEVTFNETGIRLSTLHSAKGLEFDAVFIYIPELPPAREIDDAYQERLYRNLIYVALTRAREHLEVFAHSELEDLIPRNRPSAGDAGHGSEL